MVAYHEVYGQECTESLRQLQIVRGDDLMDLQRSWVQAAKWRRPAKPDFKAAAEMFGRPDLADKIGQIESVREFLASQEAVHGG